MTMMRSWLMAAGLLALTGMSAGGQAPAPVRKELPGAVRGASVEGITEYRLANGLKVLLFPDPGKPTLTVNLTYQVGSRMENYGETGMAHLLEHMLFKGTPKHPDIPKELTAHGARSNGQTSFDRTNYFETVPASDGNLRWALELEADRMVHSYVGVDLKLAAEKLATEMTVVRNEYESGENSPGGVLYKRLLAAAYDWHNYGKMPIGARSDIENVDIGRLSAFYKTYYQPDNAVLLVAGRIDPAKTLQMVLDTFGRLPRPVRTLPRLYTQEPVQDGERQVVVRRTGDVQIVLAGYHVPAGSDPDFAPVAVLSQILGDTPTGRLHKALVETGTATAVFDHPMEQRDPSLLILGLQARAGASLDACRDGLLKVAEEPSGRTFTPEEVERAKQQLLKDIDMALNDADRVGLALSDAIAMGDWRLFFLQRDRIRAVTIQDVARVAGAYLKPSNRTLGLFVPTPSPDRAEIPPLRDVAAMVKDYRGQAAVVQGEAFDPDPMAIEARTVRHTAPNGLRMAVVPKKTRGGTVNFRLVLRLGDEQRLQGQATVGDLTADMLLRGTARHSRVQLSDELDRLKAKLRISGSAEAVVASGETDRANFPELLKLVTEILKEPAFPEKELEMLRQENLAGIEEERADPESVAQLAFERRLDSYPAGHPRHVATLDESAAAVRAVTLDQVKAFHGAFYGASSAELAIVGDVDAPAMATLVDGTLGQWASPAPFVRMPRRTKAAEPGRELLQTPDKANACFLAGLNLALQNTDPDYPALVLGDFMIGGGFLNSRLATRIRQKAGLSYSVGSELQAAAREKAGLWMAYAIYAPQNAGRLEAAFHEELTRVLRDGFTEGELRDAKAGWLQEQQLHRSQDRELAALVGMNLDTGRTMAWTAELERAIRGLSNEQVISALRKHLEPSRLVTILAGDFAKGH